MYGAGSTPVLSALNVESVLIAVLDNGRTVLHGGDLYSLRWFDSIHIHKNGAIERSRSANRKGMLKPFYNRNDSSHS